MGIKFKNKLSAGIPATGDIAEREIHLDLKNSKVFSSSNGTDVIELGVTKEEGGVEWDATAVYNANTLVTIHDPTMHPQLSYKQFFSLTSNNSGNDPLTDKVNWVENNTVKFITEDITLIVGSNGDFSNLIEAFDELPKYVATGDKKITLLVRASHTIDYTINIHHVSITTHIISEGTKIVIDASVIQGTSILYQLSMDSSPVSFRSDIEVTGTINSNTGNSVVTIFKGFWYIKNLTVDVNVTSNKPFVLFKGELTGYNIIINSSSSSLSSVLLSDAGNSFLDNATAKGKVKEVVFYMIAGHSFLSNVTTRGVTNNTAQTGVRVDRGATIVLQYGCIFKTAASSNNNNVLVNSGGTVILFQGKIAAITDSGISQAVNIITANGIIFDS